MKYIPEALQPLAPENSQLSKLYLRPTRILYKNELIGDTSQLLSPNPIQSFANSSLPRPACVLKPGAALVVDFGCEICGGVNLCTADVISSHSPRFCKLRFRFGESVNEVMAELGERGTTNDHSPRDFTESVTFMSMPEIGQTGFRFLRIDNVDEEASVILDALYAAATFRDIEYKGSFRCNDEQLNRIFDTAAYTLHLCMQEYIWDGIKRDRAVWVGDMYPEIATLCSVFGYDESVEKSLDMARNLTAPNRFMNGIFSYSIWWVWIQYRWYMQNGRKAYLNEQKDFLIHLMHQYADYIQEDGTLHVENLWALFDWPSNSSKELSVSGVHSMLKIAYEKAAFLLTELEEEREAAFCTGMAEKMGRAVLPDFDYKQIAAIHVLAGMKDAATENRRLLSQNGNSGISTFLGMFTYAARTLAGDTTGALNNIRGVYGGMLSVGATSFWEDFDPAWCKNAGRIDEFTPEGLEDIHGDRGAYCYVGFRHSLCHGWSSGVCAYLSEYVLGVRLLEPGCRSIELRPSLGDLTHVDGTYPTPYGPIEIHHTKNRDGSVSTRFTAPPQVHVTVAEG